MTCQYCSDPVNREVFTRYWLETPAVGFIPLPKFLKGFCTCEAADG